MKDTEFIELLNLYLDHELTPADCARLETEVRANPSRRRIYEDYCRMQKACKVLAADFAAEAPAADARSVLAAPARPAHRQPAGLIAIGSLAAAAACVAFVMIGRTAKETPETVALQPGPSPVAVANAETTPRVGGIVQRSALAGDSIFLTQMPAAGDSLAPQLAWLKAVQVSPMQRVVSADELRFDATLINSGNDARTLTPLQGKGESAAERSAFEFRR